MDPPQPHEEAHAPPRVGVLLAVGGALVVLTAATWLLALLPHGAWSLPVALLLAGLKAALVAVYFMELALRRGGSKVVTAVALVLVATLLVLATLETSQRFPPTIPPGPFGTLEAPGEAGARSTPHNRRAPEPPSP